MVKGVFLVMREADIQMRICTLHLPMSSDMQLGLACIQACLSAQSGPQRDHGFTPVPYGVPHRLVSWAAGLEASRTQSVII